MTDREIFRRAVREHPSQFSARGRQQAAAATAAAFFPQYRNISNEDDCHYYQPPTPAVDDDELTPQRGVTAFAPSGPVCARSSSARGTYAPFLYGQYEETLLVERDRRRTENCNFLLDFSSRKRLESARRDGRTNMVAQRNAKLEQDLRELRTGKVPILGASSNTMASQSASSSPSSSARPSPPKAAPCSDDLFVLPSVTTNSMLHDDSSPSARSASLKNHAPTGWRGHAATGAAATSGGGGQPPGGAGAAPSALSSSQTTHRDTSRLGGSVSGGEQSSSPPPPPPQKHRFRPPSSKQLIDLSKPSDAKIAVSQEKAQRIADHQREALKAWVSRSAHRGMWIRDGISRQRIRPGMIEEPPIVSIVEYERKCEEPRRSAALRALKSKPLQIVQGNGDEVDEIIRLMISTETTARREREKAEREERERRAAEALQRRLKARMELAARENSEEQDNNSGEYVNEGERA